VEACHRERQEERQDDVEDREAPEEVEERGGREHRAGGEPGAGAEAARAEPDRRRDRRHRGARGRHAGRRLVGAGHLVGERRQPVAERRLLHVDEAVAPGDEPVAGGHHLARDLRILPLVGLEERCAPEAAEEEPAGGDEECHRRDAHAGRHAVAIAVRRGTGKRATAWAGLAARGTVVGTVAAFRRLSTAPDDADRHRTRHPACRAGRTRALRA
jgi:hypothetical protein